MRSLTIASGKGGVGKTSLSANLACAWAMQGKRVLALDADLGLANLDIMLGVRPEWTLRHVVRGEIELRCAVSAVPAGFDLIAGGSGVEELVKLQGQPLEAVLSDLAGLGSSYDCVLFDNAAGLGEHVMAFASAADAVLVVCTPDPASLMDAYATAKRVYAHKPSAAMSLVVNCADSEAQAEVLYEKLRGIVGKFLNRSLDYAGCVRRDQAVALAARTREPFVVKSPNSPASRDVVRLASKLMEEATRSNPHPFLDRLRAAFSAKQAA